MANDLERFLQQAAERLAEKLNQGQPAARPVAKPLPPARQQERTRRQVEEISGEIIDAAVIEEANPRRLGPDPLSSIDTRPGLAREIDLADEKMADRIHEVLDHEIMHLGQSSAALRGNLPSVSNVGSQVHRRQRSVSPMIDLLLKPETLRAAFIAGEVFRCKF